MTPDELGRARQECFRKKAYSTEAVARHALRNAIARGFAALHVYRCPHCAQFHLGHRPGSGRPAA